MTTYRIEATDTDPQETREWVESLESLVDASGIERARFVLQRLLQSATQQDAAPDGALNTDYINTIPTHEEPPFPGDEAMEKRIRRSSVIRLE